LLLDFGRPTAKNDDCTQTKPWKMVGSCCI